MKANRETQTNLAKGRRGSLPRPAGPLRSQSGQAMLELALVTPLLLLLSIGVIEMGRYAYIGILVGNAARAGADYGAQSLAQAADTTGIQTAADNDFQSNGQPVSNLTVNSSTACGCDSGGTTTAQTCTVASANTCTSVSKQVWVVTLSVTASGTFRPMFTYPGVPSSVALSRTSTMRVVQQ